MGDGFAWGYIDTAGVFVIEPQFEYVYDFHEGLASVTLESYYDGPYGYIDKTGETVIEPIYLHAGDFSEGLAHVKVELTYSDGKWLYLED